MKTKKDFRWNKRPSNEIKRFWDVDTQKEVSIIQNENLESDAEIIKSNYRRFPGDIQQAIIRILEELIELKEKGE